MNNFRVNFLASCALLAGLLPQVLSASSDFVAQVNEIDVSGSSYSVTIAKAESPVRRIDIRCSSGCAPGVDYEEDVVDAPFSEFRLSDDSVVFFILFSTGSAQHLRAYALTPGKITRVLDVGYRELRSIGYSFGKETVVLADGKRVRQFRWTGSSFQEGRVPSK